MEVLKNPKYFLLKIKKKNIVTTKNTAHKKSLQDAQKLNFGF